MLHTCKKCGKQFEDDRKQAAVCYECRSAVCAVCGKRFIPSNKGQLTCSQKCSGIRKSQLGIAAKAASTKPTEKKICKFCGKEFLPKTFRQVYCEGPHYKPCPVCGKPVQIQTPSDPAVTCSKECQKIMTQATCTEKYGNVNVLNSEYGREKSKQSCLERYGVEDYRSSDQFKEAFRATMQERYGVDYALQNPDILAKMQQTNLERYGGVAPTCSDEVKQKIANTVQRNYGGAGMASPELRARIEATNLEKYGAKSPFSNEEIRSKIRQTLIERYGTDVVARIEGVREKIIQTNIERYGAPYLMQTALGKDRARKSLQKKYGVNNIMELQEYVDKSQKHLQAAMMDKYGAHCSMLVPEIKEKITATFQERYGVPWYTYSLDLRKGNASVISFVNISFKSLLEDNGIPCELEFPLYYDQQDARHHYMYDFKIVDELTLVEVDPTYTHNSFYNHWGTPLSEDYHKKKSQVASERGYRCIHVFDWDSWKTILKLLLPKKTVYARKCVVEKVSQKEADEFTSLNHLQGKCRGQVDNYGLYLNDQLVQIMTFGKPRYAKKHDAELLRLCTLDGFRVVGGASRLFKAYLADHPSNSIISYCNLAKFTGKVYERIGMKLDHVSPPAKIWSRKDEFITDNMLRQRGFDQIFGTHFGKGTDNEVLMLTDGWLPVYDCGQAVYVYEP